MIDINLIREGSEAVAKTLAKRGYEIEQVSKMFAELLKLDAKKRKIQTEGENLRAERNRLNDQISKAKDATERTNLIAGTKVLSEKISKINIDKIEKKIFDIMAGIPNLPMEEVQSGGKEKNRVVETIGVKPTFDFKPKDHVELCTSLGLIDYERAAKISGRGTWVYTNMGARLEWALLNYFVDFHTRNGYEFIMPPHLLNYQSGYAAGQFPKFAENIFCTSAGAGIGTKGGKAPKFSDPDFRFLLPTSETAIINLHRDEIIPQDKLPIKYFGFSPCYRREIGNYGNSERGMIRGFQFHKIEQFIFCNKEDDEQYFLEIVSNAEELVRGLGLHARTVALAAGDVGGAMAKTYDIEVYIPSMTSIEGGFKEVSSCSTAQQYQARRAAIRTKRTTTEFVHTLNASGLATSRLIPAIVEQFQTADGRVRVPEVLQKYLGGAKFL
ncbi:MAG: serine--tRNA ligase [Firmicutes bacterium]|nr:serine--tRNA ligase [Bacillota bacterium]